MPELSEVEITRLKLLPLVRGRAILNFWTDWRRGLRIMSSEQRAVSSMRGRKILNVTRHGKILFFELSGKPERKFAVHLRMSGRLAVISAKEPRNTWVHDIWVLSGKKELRFIDPRKFGRVWYGSSADLLRDPYLGALGTDAKNISRKRFHTVFRGGKGAVKPFLLRQDRLAGIGNIIADESLWKAKIHPQTQISELSEIERDRLLYSLRSTLSAMMLFGGTTLRDWCHPDGAQWSFQNYRQVYGKAGKPCPRCCTPLIRLIVGGRGTTVCAKCQRL